MRTLFVVFVSVAMASGMVRAQGFNLECQLEHSYLENVQGMPSPGDDVDGDGNAEIVLRDVSGWPDSGGIVVLDSSYSEIWSYSRSGLAGDLIYKGFADMNGDGACELLVSYWSAAASEFVIDVVDYPNDTVVATLQYSNQGDIVDVDRDGRMEVVTSDYNGLTQIWSMASTTSSVQESIPPRAHLSQNHPNPFNPQTTIVFELSQEEPIALRVYDVTGRLVRTLIDGGVYGEGRHEVTWSGTDDSGNRMASGTYFYRLEADSFSEPKKMILLK